MHRSVTVTVAAGVLAASAVAPAIAATIHPGPAGGRATCALGPGGSIKHVIYIQFDNTHYTPDNPNVPSDLRQMPALLSFITGNGTLITHEHTPLIAHTANDIVTSESGLYPDHHGMPIANEYNYYKPDGSTDTAGSFAYWTDPIVDYSTPTGNPVGDHSPTMVGPDGAIAPAPWVPYTRAGCDFGTVAGANTELENLTPDVPLVFGPRSPQAREAENPKLANKASADFMGLVIHCAAASAVCAHGARPDVLPDEPGGYLGYRALFGYTFVQPAISPSGAVRSLDGAVIKDSSGDIGFPGYNAMTGPNALAFTLDMQLHGVAVTDTYLTDLHESWVTGNPFGPGERGYVQQARAENAAFAAFFSRLAAHGITTANTLFVITSDEGDHFVGGPPSPAGCDGVTTPCGYKQIGEVDGNLTGLLAARGIRTPFDVAADSAPELYVHGQPGRTARQVRGLERALARLTGHDLATGRTVRLTRFLADPVELKILHMLTGDPKRNPTVAVFGNQDFWLSSGPAACGSSCFTENSGEAWNHGTIAPAINTTWLGVAGPGVARLGIDGSAWSEHADIQPTMLALLGLRDDYAPDGRALSEIIARLRHRHVLTALGRAYTAIEAPVGPFALATLRAATVALASASPGDRVYTRIERALARLGAERDSLGGQMRALLDGAAFDGKPVNDQQARALIRAAERLLAAAASLAG
jgi:hypothetical protein